jgi:ribosome-associated translation inhibitor RaiA
MQVQVNTGDGLEGKDTLERWATDFLNAELARFANEISRVEVQLTDEAKGKKNGEDMRCMLEARLNGHQPVAVQHHAENMDEAIRGASIKLVRALEHIQGRLDRHEHRTRYTIRREPDAVEVKPGTELT